jgi:ubiquinol-cytochrome c reductase cytochrome b/c1 subunit
MRRTLIAVMSSGLVTCAVLALFYWRMTHRDPMQIIPDWYMLPFYAILRAIPGKIIGVIAAIGAIFGAALLPWLLASNEKSTMFRPIALVCFVAFDVSVVTLGACGAHLPDAPVFAALPALPLLDGDLNSYIWLSRFAAVYYFAYIVVIVPMLGGKAPEVGAA